MKRASLLFALLTLGLLWGAGTAYGGSSPVWPHTVAGPPSRAAGVVEPAPAWSPVGLVGALSGTGVVQGHVYDYYGVPAAGATVLIQAYDESGSGVLLWQHETTTDMDGSFSASDAPATTHGWIEVGVTRDDHRDYLDQGWLTFADPGTSTYDFWPGRVAWTAQRGGPWATGWRSPSIQTAGVGPSGGPAFTFSRRYGVATGTVVSDWASALPADVRVAQFSFWSDEAALWDIADHGDVPVPVTSGGTATLPVTFDQASAYRIWFSNSYWYSGKPGTTLRLALQNYPAGMQNEFSGYSDSPNGVETTWGGKSYSSTGPQQQTVSLKIPDTAKPGYGFNVSAFEPVTRYDVYYFGLDEYFQVCTLNSSKTAVRAGATVKLSGVVPVQGHWGASPGVRKYVWIYKRTKAASAAPKTWDATTKGWKLVGRVRTDGYGRYHRYVSPSATTWYVARYAGDDWYWRAYTSVRKVRVY